MKQFICSFFFCTIMSFCYSQSQSDMNVKASTNFQKAEAELNTVYKKILKEYKSDTVFIINLKKAQQIWIQFRNAEMNAKFPNKEPGYYGSVLPLCWNSYKQELTEERIKKLKIWLTGIEEGDTCSGSVKMKN